MDRPAPPAPNAPTPLLDPETGLPFPPHASSGLGVRREDLDPALRPFVAEVYEEVALTPPGRPVRATICATTEPVLNVTLSGEVVVRLPRALRIPPFRIPPFRIPPVVIAGPQPAAYEITVAGLWRGFFVRFTPVGPLALLGVRDYGLSARGAPTLHEAVRPALADEARRYGEAVLAAPDFGARVALTDRFLLARLPEVPPETGLLQRAIAEIEASSGNVRMGELAARLGVSASTLRRRFRVLGLPAKRFADVVRFRRAHAHLHTTSGATWAETAGRFGYADQAHFVRDYRRFAGVCPTGWAPEDRLIDQRMGIEEPARLEEVR